MKLGDSVPHKASFTGSAANSDCSGVTNANCFDRAAFFEASIDEQLNGTEQLILRRVDTTYVQVPLIVNSLRGSAWDRVKATGEAQNADRANK